MANIKEDTVTTEVKRRLEDLFGEGNESIESVEDSGDIEDSPLRELKAIVLSIDWEITDEIMGSFIEQIGRLKDKYRDDKILVLFLQLLGSVGKHIKTNKANAHPDAIKLLISVYTSLEKVLLSKDIRVSERKKILFVELNRFKILKEEIAIRKAKAAEEKEVKPPEEIRPEVEEKEVVVQEEIRPPAEAKEELLPSEISGMTPHEAFAYALEEIKHVIKAEFDALRAELKLWREGQ